MAFPCGGHLGCGQAWLAFKRTANSPVRDLLPEKTRDGPVSGELSCWLFCSMTQKSKAAAGADVFGPLF